MTESLFARLAWNKRKARKELWKSICRRRTTKKKATVKVDPLPSTIRDILRVERRGKHFSSFFLLCTTVRKEDKKVSAATTSLRLLFCHFIRPFFQSSVSRLKASSSPVGEWKTGYMYMYNPAVLLPVSQSQMGKGIFYRLEKEFKAGFFSLSGGDILYFKGKCPIVLNCTRISWQERWLLCSPSAEVMYSYRTIQRNYMLQLYIIFPLWSTMHHHASL